MSLWFKKFVLASVLAFATAVQGFAGQSQTAVIKGMTDGSALYSKVSVSPGLLDGKNYRKALKNKIEVPAGNRVVQLNINARFGFNEMDYMGRIPFRAKLEPGNAYETSGRIRGRTIEVWIADASTNELASKVLAITIERCYIRFNCPKPSFETRSGL
jgi:hypothetical protein